MKKWYLVVGLFIGAWFCSTAQCLTDKYKLLPERTNELYRYGDAVALGGEFLAIADPQSDTLGVRNGGAVFLYQRFPAGWNLVGLLKPSNPKDFLQFGYSVSISDDGGTVAVAAFGYGTPDTESAVYIFHRPTGGWTTMTETTRITFSNPALETNTNVHLHDRGTSLFIGQRYEGSGTGKVYHLRRSIDGRFSQSSSKIILRPSAAAEFGASIKTIDNLLVIGAPGYRQGIGGICVYRMNESTLDYELKGILESSERPGLSNKLGEKLFVSESIIGSNAWVYKSNELRQNIFLFKKNGEEEWVNSTELSQITVTAPGQNFWTLLAGIELISPNSIALACAFSNANDESQKLIGRMTVLTAANSDWTEVNRTVIHEEELMKRAYSLKDYGTYTAWNGREFVFSPTRSGTATNHIQSVTTFSLSNGIWGSLVKTRLPYVNSNEHYFGLSIVQNQNTLFVSSPKDDEGGTDAGAVYIYNRSEANGWSKLTKVVGPVTEVTDNYFGGAVANYADVLAVGASAYNTRGLVVTYKATSSDWSTVDKEQEITPPIPTMYYFGNQVAVSDKVLVATGLNSAIPNGTGNAIAIYRRVDDKWEFAQVYNFSNAWLKGSTCTVAVRGDSILAYSGLGGYLAEGTEVVLLTPKDNVWEKRTTFVVPQEISLALASIEFSEDHVFIGAPTTSKDGVSGVGAVVVYAKPNGTPWPSGTVYHSSIIYPKEVRENQYFGYSLSNTANTLAVGAPGSDVNSNFTVRQVPGDVFLIVAKDYLWKNTSEYLKFQGDSYNIDKKDKMGWAVETSYGEYFLGAPFETNGLGTEAGAVYTVPTPPLVKLAPPVCTSSGKQELVGYPSGGLWSGVGVVSMGGKYFFDPQLAGKGVFELVYQTTNCENTGILQVDVYESPTVNMLTPSQLNVCPQNPINLKVNPLPLASYQWYFKPTTSESFSRVPGAVSTEINVSVAGSYYVAVNTGYCTVSSTITSVGYEFPNLSIGPQPIVCESKNSVDLKVTATGGVWQGTGIVNPIKGTFDPNGLTNGKYSVLYEFTSTTGCHYSLRDTVVVDVIPEIQLQRQPTDFCLTGSATISTSVAQSHWIYSWLVKSDTVWNVIDAVSVSTRTFVDAGEYGVRVSSQYCTKESKSILIGLENDLAMELTPSGEPLNVCGKDNLNLSLTVRNDADVEWLWRADSLSDFSLVAAGSAVTASKSGTYRVVAVLGFCEATITRNITFVSEERTDVPNVFTPNGDGKNDHFSIDSPVSNYLLSVFNRYGREIFQSSNQSVPWDGGNAPAGVYYWSLNYRNCKNEERHQRGFVHLVR